MITVVSGLPRSGTSLTMQMLAAGGLPVLTDGVRAADEDNPRGYFEWERIRSLPRDAACIAEAEGKAVKVISALLRFLPSDRTYRIIFLRRALDEVVASQDVMLQHRQAATPSDSRAIAEAFRTHLAEVDAWLDRQPNLAVCRVEYTELLADAAGQARKIAGFLEMPLDIDAMSAQVARDLYRQRLPR